MESRVPAKSPSRRGRTRLADPRAVGRERALYESETWRRRGAMIGNGQEPMLVLLLIQNDGSGRLERCAGLSQGILEAIRAGASDAIGTPSGELLASVARALDPAQRTDSLPRRGSHAERPFADLTPRQREIMELVLAGHPNKIIAADLGISQRTVENHRASVMRKTGAKSLPALVRLAMMAGQTDFAARTSRH